MWPEERVQALRLKLKQMTGICSAPIQQGHTRISPFHGTTECQDWGMNSGLHDHKWSYLLHHGQSERKKNTHNCFHLHLITVRHLFMFVVSCLPFVFLLSMASCWFLPHFSLFFFLLFVVYFVFETQVCFSIAPCLWANFLTSLSFGSLVFQSRIIKQMPYAFYHVTLPPWPRKLPSVMAFCCLL